MFNLLLTAHNMHNGAQLSIIMNRVCQNYAFWHFHYAQLIISIIHFLNNECLHTHFTRHKHIFE